MSHTHRLAVAADAAAADLAATRGVHSVRGTVERDHGRLVLHLSAVLEPDLDLGSVIRRLEGLADRVRDVDRHLPAPRRVDCRFTLTCTGPAAPPGSRGG